MGDGMIQQRLRIQGRGGSQDSGLVVARTGQLCCCIGEDLGRELINALSGHRQRLAGVPTTRFNVDSKGRIPSQPGFWRQDQHFDSWALTGYSPNDAYDPTFGVNGSFETLLDAVWAKGGDENALARHAVAALLNAASPEVDYAYSVAEVLAMVQAAYASGDFEDTKDNFEYQNELGCPLD